MCDSEYEYIRHLQAFQRKELRLEFSAPFTPKENGNVQRIGNTAVEILDVYLHPIRD